MKRRTTERRLLWTTEMKQVNEAKFTLGAPIEELLGKRMEDARKSKKSKRSKKMSKSSRAGGPKMNRPGPEMTPDGWDVAEKRKAWCMSDKRSARYHTTADCPRMKNAELPIHEAEMDAEWLVVKTEQDLVELHGHFGDETFGRLHCRFCEGELEFPADC